MKFSPHRRRKAPAVIIVSLIDVLLVVMIFLMVTTTFKKLEPSLQLALPESREASVGASEPSSLTILIATNEPYLYLEGQPISVNELEKAMVAAAAQDPKVRIDIKSDKRAPVGELIRIIDVAKRAKVGSINAIVEKAP